MWGPDLVSNPTLRSTQNSSILLKRILEVKNKLKPPTPPKVNYPFKSNIDVNGRLKQVLKKNVKKSGISKLGFGPIAPWFSLLY